MNYKGCKITVEKMWGYVWTVELPNGDSFDPVDPSELHETKKDAIEQAKEIIDNLIKLTDTSQNQKKG